LLTVPGGQRWVSTPCALTEVAARVTAANETNKRFNID
jgi:hypothetical protein